MKWFKHDTRARNDAKLAKVIMRHGIEGYGLYFACLEIIAEELTPENFTFELEHDAELLASLFRMDTVKVERIMLDFIELGLFEMSSTTKRIACYKLAKRLDNATSQNREVQEILGNFKQLKETLSDSKQIRLEENRLEIKDSSANEKLFAEFWAVYPKKKNKGDAKKAWKKIKHKWDTLELIKDAISWQKGSSDWIKENGQFIPYPATYLNKTVWEDEPPEDNTPNRTETPEQTAKRVRLENEALERMNAS